jgi:hypothetical protein
MALNKMSIAPALRTTLSTCYRTVSSLNASLRPPRPTAATDDFIGGIKPRPAYGVPQTFVPSGSERARYRAPDGAAASVDDGALVLKQHSILLVFLAIAKRRAWGRRRAIGQV